MTTKSSILILFLLFSLFTMGQSEIGVSAGVNRSGFYGFKGRYGRNSNVPIVKHRLNYVVAFNYKEAVTERLFTGFELENIQMKSDIRLLVSQNHFYAYIMDATVNMNYINLHFLFGGKLFSIKKVDVLGTLSPFYGYLINVGGVGYDTEPKSVLYKDSLGIEHLYINSIKRDIKGSKSFRRANIGLRVDLDVHIPFNDKLALSLKPAYHLGIYDVIKEDGYVGTAGFTFTAGVIYHLDKKYLRLSENIK